MSKSKKDAKSTHINKFLAVLFVIAFIVGLSALWVNRIIFNQENFTNTVTKSLTQESSRDAIATFVVNNALENRPIAKRVLDDRLVSMISGLLGSDSSEKLISKLSTGIHKVVLTSFDEDIKIDLTEIKGTLIQLQNIATDIPQEERRVDPNQIPDEIVFVEKGSMPKFYKYQSVFLALWIICAGIIAFTGTKIYKSKDSAKESIRYLSKLTLITSLIGLAVGPLAKPPLINSLKTEEGSIVIGNLYNDFLNPYVMVMGLILITSIVVWAGTHIVSDFYKGFKGEA